MSKVSVGGPYPCWISIQLQSGAEIRISHTELLELRHAVDEATRKTLMKLPKRDWHEVGAQFAVTTGENT